MTTGLHPRALRWTGLAALLLLLLSALVVFVAVDREPHFLRAQALQPEVIVEASRSLRRLDPRMEPNERAAQTGPVVLGASAADALAHDLALRLLRGSGARLTFGEGDVRAGLSVPLAALVQGRGLPAGVWLNLQATVQARDTGLPRLTSVQVGGWRLPVPAGLLHRVVAWRLGEQRAQQLYAAAQAVEQVALSPQGLRVTLLPQASRAQQWRHRLLSGVDAQALQAHHTHLIDSLQRPGLPPQGDLPLTAVLGPQLAFAQQQATGGSPGAAALGAGIIGPGLTAAHSRRLSQEYRLALLALSLWAVGVEPSSLVPELQWASLPKPRRHVALRGRNDHALHFLLSALLAMGSDPALADAVGLYKELADVGDRKGSGFSFDDLAADKAGVAFGEMAWHRPQQLAPRQALMIDDVFIMPAVEGLPTGLSAAQFEARFGRVDSPAYRAMLAEVERRVAAVPLLR